MTLTPSQSGFVLSYDNQTTFGDIQLLGATAVDASGQAGGDIQIQARRVILRGGSAIEASTLGNAAGGTIRVTALQGVELSGTTADNPQDSRRLVTSISADNRGTGRTPGELTVNTARLTIRNGARISASTKDEGVGGDININATDLVELVGTGISSGGQRSSGISVQTRGAGRAGDLRITTRQLLVREGAEVSASTFGTGNGGNVYIQATERIDLTGTSPDGSLRSRIVAEVGKRGEVINPVEIIPAVAQGGDVNVTTHQLTIQAGAAISVSSRTPTGQAGNLNITANTIVLDQGRITAETSAGSGAEITLQGLNLLLLRNNSLISAQASALADGGNVTVNTLNGFVVATPAQNSDIIAAASQGTGGDISINGSQGIFGIEEQTAVPQNQTNDIDASSQFNQSGTVTISQPNVDPSQGLIELPTDVVDRSTQIARGCGSRSNESGRFVVTGRGGLPLSPDQPLQNRSIVSPNWVSLDSEFGDASTSGPQSQDENRLEQADLPANVIVEANGLSRDADGKRVLVAQSHATEHATEPNGLWTLPIQCDRP
ncbi:MAG: S-layer family protein [Leptolyngbyaceae cyanobacterium CRU_2_3]|nr:S-layer family protein [Leptolyngbyaceae cyanobacterium CRU_2_3]